MGELIYFASPSLDGYIDDADGGFGWAEPTPEVHHFVNDLQASIGTFLLGRRSYEVMTWWEHMGADDPDGPPEGDPEMEAAMVDFGAHWARVDKVVYSTTMAEADITTARTRLERGLDLEALARAKAEAVLDLSIGGAVLGGQAITGGLVDEYQLLLNPVLVGGGTRALPDGAHVGLELVEQRHFAGGAVFLRYRAR